MRTEARPACVPAVRLTIMGSGEEGVDRGALEAALEQGVACAGWCAEDSAGPAQRYSLTPLPGSDARARTRRNVLESDGTVIILFGPPSGSSKDTLELCLRHRKPHLLVDATRLFCVAAAQRMASFASSLPRGRLHVTGPRADQAPGAHGYACETVARVIQELRQRETSSGRKGDSRVQRPRGGSGRAPDQQSRAPDPAAGPSIVGARAMEKFCHSCGVALQIPGMAGPAGPYCRHCSDDRGKLKKRKEIRAGIASWMRSWQPGLSKKQALKRARRYMRAMPAWAD